MLLGLSLYSDCDQLSSSQKERAFKLLCLLIFCDNITTTFVDTIKRLSKKTPINIGLVQTTSLNIEFVQNNNNL